MISTMIAWSSILLWMGVIFYLSHQPGGDSSNLSGGILDFIDSFVPFFNLTEHEWIHTLLRKGAHIGAYFILGVLVMFGLHTTPIAGKRQLFIAFLICVLYAISDEIHQLYIPGRSGQLSDVLIDSIGGAAGIAFYWLMSVRFTQRTNQ